MLRDWLVVEDMCKPLHKDAWTAATNTRIYGTSCHWADHLLEKAQRLVLIEHYELPSWISIGCGLREIGNHTMCVALQYPSLCIWGVTKTDIAKGKTV